MECPRCRAGVMESDESEDFRCPVCGFSVFSNNLKASLPVAAVSATETDAARRKRIIRRIEPVVDQATPPAFRPQPPVPVNLPHVLAVGTIPGLNDYERLRLEGRCQQAMIEIGRGDYEAARQALRSALEISDLSDQVWLFLAGLAENAAQQRDYLENAIACNPGNQHAVNALVRLNQQAEGIEPPASRERLEPDQVESRHIACPICGGQLDYDVGGREVVCRFCGYGVLDADAMTRSGTQTPLQAGLLTRKQQAQVWNIGQRWLRCENCGAITTLSQRTLTNTCRFCDSRQIIQEGVNLRFEQPDFVIPFTVDEGQARAAVQAKLRSGIRMITRFFADAVERIDLHGVYLPVWVFDAQMVVNWSWTNAPDRGQHPILLGDVLFFAAKTLPAELIRQIEPYDLLDGVDYDPRLLAVHPAGLYEIDVDRASLDVRPRLKRLAERRARPSLMVRRPSRGYSRFGDDGGPGSLRMNATTSYLSYRFGLFPVWVARLVEADGDTRQVLVNGQTAAAALGELEKQRG